MTSMPSGARSKGMPAETIRGIVASSSRRRRSADARRLRIALGEGLGEIVLGGVEADKFGAGVQQAVDLAVNMGVVDADRGETKFGHAILSL